jgi:hypothetical protein
MLGVAVLLVSPLLVMGRWTLKSSYFGLSTRMKSAVT